jgi:nucleotide-binding universal stress UspA family protein
MKSFLCALDFSDEADKVLKVASDLSVKHGAHLTILFPYRLLPTESKDEAHTLKQKILSNAQRMFDDLDGKLRLTGRVNFDFKPEIGFLSDRIELRARKHDVDMVVLSNHQAQLVNDQLGTSIQQLLTELNIPYVVVSDNTKG